MATAAQKRPYSIALGGTSLTNGRLATAWDTEFQKTLEQAVDRPVIVVNFGKGSQTSTSWGVPTMDEIAALKPDLIVTEGYGINDCALGVTRAEHNANLDTMIGHWLANSPRSRICLQTMSPASSGDALRTNLGDYYGDEIAKAIQYGIDSLNHYINWPNPLPVALTQSSDGLHPIASAVRQYFLPTLVAYAKPIILAAP